MDNNTKKKLLLKNQSILFYQIKRSRKLVLAQLATGVLFLLAFFISVYLRFVLGPTSFPLALFLTLCLFLFLILWKDLLFVRLFKLSSDSLTKIEPSSDYPPPFIGLLPFINEVIWFLSPLKTENSYTSNKTQFIEKRMRNELYQHIILIIIIILNYFLTIHELSLYSINSTGFSLLHGIWLLIIFLSFLRTFFFIYWKNIVSRWVITSEDIDDWERILKTV